MSGVFSLACPVVVLLACALVNWLLFSGRLVPASALAATKRGCRHPKTVVVDSIVTGEPLARLCLTCDKQV